MKRLKVMFTQDSPHSGYGYYKRGDTGWIDGYTGDCAVVIKEDGSFVKADLRWIKCVNKTDVVELEK